MKKSSTTWRFWLFWILAFFSFPIAGLLAVFVVPVTTPVRALIAGAIAGAALGLVQWLILKSRLPLLSIWWTVAMSIGMAIGLAIGTALLGSETGGNELIVARRHYGSVHWHCAVDDPSAGPALASIDHLDWGCGCWLGSWHGL